MAITKQELENAGDYIKKNYLKVGKQLNVPIHSSMSFSVIEPEPGKYQVQAISEFGNSFNFDISEEQVKQFSTTMVQERNEQIKAQAKAAANKISQEKAQEAEQKIAQERRHQMLSHFRASPQSFTDDEIRRQMNDILHTSYKTSPAIKKSFGDVSIGSNEYILIKKQGGDIHITAMDERYGKTIEITLPVKQVQALCKLHKLDMIEKNWNVLQVDSKSNQGLQTGANQGSLYLAFANTEQGEQAIKDINSAYGEGACRKSGSSDGFYVKIENTSENGKKAIKDLLAAMNMTEVPKVEDKAKQTKGIK